MIVVVVILYMYTQILEHRGTKFWCYNAGHVLGAAMFMIEIAGVHVLYTGDYSMEVYPQ
jgi:cleavage and polyadenylation specificity factor subunit 3